MLANAFIASLALGEPLRCRDLLGCLLCAGGGIVIVVSTPANPVDTDVDVFLANAQAPQLFTSPSPSPRPSSPSSPSPSPSPSPNTTPSPSQEPPFVLYMLLLTATVLCMLHFRERFGRRHVGYYVLLCSPLGMVRRAVLARRATAATNLAAASLQPSCIRPAAVLQPSCSRPAAVRQPYATAAAST